MQPSDSRQGFGERKTIQLVEISEIFLYNFAWIRFCAQEKNSCVAMDFRRLEGIEENPCCQKEKACREPVINFCTYTPGDGGTYSSMKAK
jgi:hypothetical protein